MVSNNIRMDSGTEVDLRDLGPNKSSKDKSTLADNGFLFHTSNRIYSYKMGEAQLKLFNVIGVTSMLYSFFANLNINPILSISLGAVSLVYGIFIALKTREDWLIRRSERREKEYDFDKKKKKTA